MRKAQGLYIISVASQILEMHPQTLRKYERAGFIEPPRMGTLRLYSEEDIARLRLIKYFVEELGLNLAGVELALGLTNRLLALRTRLSSRDDAEAVRAQAVGAVDRILYDLGIQVAKEAPRPSGETGAAPPVGVTPRSQAGTGPTRINQTTTSPRRAPIR
ncbi:MAG: MerR family transcriptional regulator [Dehalococcoidia bacterium]